MSWLRGILGFCSIFLLLGMFQEDTYTRVEEITLEKDGEIQIFSLYIPKENPNQDMMAYLLGEKKDFWELGSPMVLGVKGHNPWGKDNEEASQWLKRVTNLPIEPGKALLAMDITGDGEKEIVCLGLSLGASSGTIQSYIFSPHKRDFLQGAFTPEGMLPMGVSLEGGIFFLDVEPRFSGQKIIIVDYIWGDNEARYAPHHWMINIAVYSQMHEEYFLYRSAETSKKYDFWHRPSLKTLLGLVGY